MKAIITGLIMFYLGYRLAAKVTTDNANHDDTAMTDRRGLWEWLKGSWCWLWDVTDTWLWLKASAHNHEGIWQWLYLKHVWLAEKLTPFGY